MSFLDPTHRQQFPIPTLHSAKPRRQHANCFPWSRRPIECWSETPASPPSPVLTLQKTEAQRCEGSTCFPSSDTGTEQREICTRFCDLVGKTLCKRAALLLVTPATLSALWRVGWRFSELQCGPWVVPTAFELGVDRKVTQHSRSLLRTPRTRCLPPHPGS